ncbi:ATP-binding protein [Lysobacter solisilvae (ex Woo and Kim 2020)]|uniref:AAA family ATPase n=1 Tax=Agrilutibacter terrestris TaxID=2865112 RepID=A0A7H0FZU6_9GAMM|nr:LuxR family transcriptional regulator [Lysobacter terrestris]QNP41562.1 AAA family ATPase [Lysobacter terrestris]
MQLFERDSLLGTLERLLHEAADGAGRVVFVGGEAGIGKTCLATALRDRRGAAGLWWGACDALQTPHPLAPLHDIARAQPVRFKPLLAQEGGRAPLFEAVLAELQAATAPTLFVVEDAHWADEATLDLLKFLGRRLEQLRCLLLVTYRDDEVTAQHPLRRLMGELPAARVTRLQVPRLSADAVEAMAKGALRAHDGLHALTRGNPFFVSELLQHGMDGVPQGVQDLVLARFARLGPMAQQVMQLASIVPRRIDDWLMQDVLAPPLAAIEECLDAGLLVADGDRQALAFRHELARVAIEQSLSRLRAQELHVQVLAALAHAEPARVSLAWRVHHADRARDAAAVLQLAPDAALEAQRRGAHLEAAAHLRTALAYAGQQPDPVRAVLLDRLAYESYLTDRIEDALVARHAARELWRRMGDRLKEGDAIRWLSRLSWYNGQTAVAEAHADEAISVLAALPPGRELAMAYSNRAQLHMLQGESADAVALGTRALALAVELGDVEIQANALNNIGTARLDAGDEAGRAELEQSLALALAGGFEEHAARAYVNLSFDAVMLMRFPVALAWLERGIAYCDARDLDAWARYMSAYQAAAWFALGEWQRAADQAALVLQAPNLAPINRIVALTVLAHVRVRRGDPDAPPLLDEALQLALPTRSLLRFGPVIAAQVEAARLRDDHAACMAAIAPLATLEHRSGYRSWVLAEIDCQLRLAGIPHAPAEHCPPPFALQFAGHWREAADAWRALGCPYETARALAAGDAPAQREALAAFERLGAAPIVERLRRELRESGVRGVPRGQRATTQANPHALTEREVEVLRLLCDGLRNAQIAQRLSRSVRTVDHHVAAIFAKLGVSTRTEAMAAALAAGLHPQK